MGKRNYQKVQKYRRRRARLLEVGDLFGHVFPTAPFVPTEQIGVPVPPPNASSSTEDNSKESEKEPPSVENVTEVVHNDDDDDDDDAHNTADTFHPGDNVQLGMDLLKVCTETKVPLETYDKILRIFKKILPWPIRHKVVEQHTNPRKAYEDTEVKSTNREPISTPSYSRSPGCTDKVSVYVTVT